MKRSKHCTASLLCQFNGHNTNQRINGFLLHHPLIGASSTTIPRTGWMDGQYWSLVFIRDGTDRHRFAFLLLLRGILGVYLTSIYARDLRHGIDIAWRAEYMMDRSFI